MPAMESAWLALSSCYQSLDNPSTLPYPGSCTSHHCLPEPWGEFVDDQDECGDDSHVDSDDNNYYETKVTTATTTGEKIV